MWNPSCNYPAITHQTNDMLYIVNHFYTWSKPWNMVAVIHCINRFWATGPHPSRVTLSSCCPLTPSAPRVTARALDVESGFVSAGWWLSPTPLKNMKVKWEYDSQYMEKSKMFQTTNQSECCSWGWMVSGFENTNRNACSTKTYQDYIINIIYIIHVNHLARDSQKLTQVLVNIRKSQISMSKTRSEKCAVMPLKYDHVCWGCW